VKTQKLLEKIKKDIQKRKNLSPVFSSADEAIKHLNS